MPAKSRLLLYVISTAEVPPTPTLLHCVCFISALAHVFDLLTMLRNIIFFLLLFWEEVREFLCAGIQKDGGKREQDDALVLTSRLGFGVGMFMNAFGRHVSTLVK